MSWVICVYIIHSLKLRIIHEYVTVYSVDIVILGFEKCEVSMGYLLSIAKMTNWME